MGAQAAGFSGALLTRPGNAALPLDGIPQPQGAAPDLPGLAKQLIALWRG
jgi:2-haloacid dehalogenase